MCCAPTRPHPRPPSVSFIAQLRSSTASTVGAAAAAWAAVGDAQAQLLRAAVADDPAAAALHRGAMATAAVAGDESGKGGAEGAAVTAREHVAAAGETAHPAAASGETAAAAAPPAAPVATVGGAAAEAASRPAAPGAAAAGGVPTVAAAAGGPCKRPRSPSPPPPLPPPRSPGPAAAAAPRPSAPSPAEGGAPPGAAEPLKRLRLLSPPRPRPPPSEAAAQPLPSPAAVASPGGSAGAAAPTGGVAAPAVTPPRKRPRSPSSPATSPRPWRPSTLRWGRPRLVFHDVPRAASPVASPPVASAPAVARPRLPPVFGVIELPLPLPPPSPSEAVLLCQREPRRARRAGLGGCAVPRTWPAPVYRYGGSGGRWGEGAASAPAACAHVSLSGEAPASAAAASCGRGASPPAKQPLVASEPPPLPRVLRLVLRPPRPPASPPPTVVKPRLGRPLSPPSSMASPAAPSPATANAGGRRLPVGEEPSPVRLTGAHSRVYSGMSPPVPPRPSPFRRRLRVPALPEADDAAVAAARGVEGDPPSVRRRQLRVPALPEGDFVLASTRDEHGTRPSPEKRRLRVPELPEEEGTAESNERGSRISTWLSTTSSRRPRLRVDISSDDDGPDGPWGAGEPEDSSGPSDEEGHWATAANGEWRVRRRRRRGRLVKTACVKSESPDRHRDLNEEEVDAVFASDGSSDCDSDGNGSGVSTANDEEVLAWGEVGDARPPKPATGGVATATPYGGGRRRERPWGAEAQVAAALRRRGRRSRRLQRRMRRDGATAQADASGEASFPSSGPASLRMLLAAVVAVTTPPRPPYAGLGTITSHLRLASCGQKYKAAHVGLSRLVAYGALVTAPDDWAPDRARTSVGARRAYAVPRDVEPALLDAVCDGRVLSPEGELLDAAAGRALARSRIPPRVTKGFKAEQERRPRPWEPGTTSDDDAGDSEDDGQVDKNGDGGGDGDGDDGGDCGGGGGGRGAVHAPPSLRMSPQPAVDGGRLVTAYSLGAALAAAMAIGAKSGGVAQPVAQPVSTDRPPESAAAEPPPPAPQSAMSMSDERLRLPPPLESLVLPAAPATAAESPWHDVVDGDAAGEDVAVSLLRPSSSQCSGWRPGRRRAPAGYLEPSVVFAAAAARLLRHPRLTGHTYADLVAAVSVAGPGGPPPPPPPSPRFPDAIPGTYLRMLVMGLMAAGPPNVAWRPADVMWTLFMPSFGRTRTDRSRIYSAVWVALNTLVSKGVLATTYPPSTDEGRARRPAIGMLTTGGWAKHYVVLPGGTAIAAATASSKGWSRGKRDMEEAVGWPGSAYDALAAAAASEQTAAAAAAAAADGQRGAVAARDTLVRLEAPRPPLAAAAATAAGSPAATPPALQVEAPLAPSPGVALSFRSSWAPAAVPPVAPPPAPRPGLAPAVRAPVVASPSSLPVVAPPASQSLVSSPTPRPVIAPPAPRPEVAQQTSRPTHQLVVAPLADRPVVAPPARRLVGGQPAPRPAPLPVVAPPAPLPPRVPLPVRPAPLQVAAPIAPPSTRLSLPLLSVVEPAVPPPLASLPPSLRRAPAAAVEPVTAPPSPPRRPVSGVPAGATPSAAAHLSTALTVLVEGPQPLYGAPSAGGAQPPLPPSATVAPVGGAPRSTPSAARSTVARPVLVAAAAPSEPSVGVPPTPSLAHASGGAQPACAPAAAPPPPGAPLRPAGVAPVPPPPTGAALVPPGTPAAAATAATTSPSSVPSTPTATHSPAYGPLPVVAPAPAGAAAAALRAHLLRAVAARPVAATRSALVADALAATTATATVGAAVDGPSWRPLAAAVSGAERAAAAAAAATAAAACLRGLVASGQLREGLGGTYLLAWGRCVLGGAVVKVEPT